MFAFGENEMMVTRKLMVTAAAALVSTALLATQAPAQNDQGRGQNRGSMQQMSPSGGSGRADQGMRSGGSADVGIGAQGSSRGLRAEGRADARNRDSLRANARVESGERTNFRTRSDRTPVSVRSDRGDRIAFSGRSDQRDFAFRDSRRSRASVSVGFGGYDPGYYDYGHDSYAYAAPYAYDSYASSYPYRRAYSSYAAAPCTCSSYGAYATYPYDSYASSGPYLSVGFGFGRRWDGWRW